jgi:membrane protease YdiL (CAAX protease family)
MNWNWPSVWSDERGGWWRVPVTFIVFGGTAFLLGLVAVVVLKNLGIQDAFKDGSAGVKAGLHMFLIVLPLCCSGLGCLLGIAVVHRKPISCVFTDGRPFGFALLFQSMAVWGVLWLLGVILFPGGLAELSGRFRELRPSSWPGVCLALFGVISLQAATEEIIDRGYLQTRMAAWVKRPWIAIFVSTTVFTVLHTEDMTIPARLRIVAFGIVLGVALVRAGTTAPLIGMHAINNTLNATWLADRTNANRNELELCYVIIQLSVWLGWLFWVTKQKPKTDIASEAKNETVAPA